MDLTECCLCLKSVDVSAENAVRLTCRAKGCGHDGDSIYHVDCHLKRMKSILHNNQMLKAGHAANFSCPRPHCPGKIKNIAWLEGRKNDVKKQKRIEAAIKAATLPRHKPVPPPGPPPKPKVAQPVQNQSRNAPIPVTTTFVSSKATKLAPAQQAAYMDAMRKAAQEARAQLGLISGSCAAAPTGNPAAKAAVPSVPQPGLKIISLAKRSDAAKPQQTMASHHPWGIAQEAAGVCVHDHLRSGLQSAIPGAVFVERKKKIKKADAARAPVSASGSSLSWSDSCMSKEVDDTQDTLTDFDRDASDMLRGAAAKEGYISNVQSYLDMLRSMGMTLDYADSDDSAGDQEGEGEEQLVEAPTQDSMEFSATATQVGSSAERDEQADDGLDAWLEGGGLDENGALWFKDSDSWFVAHPDGRLEPKDGPPAAPGSGALKSPANILLSDTPQAHTHDHQTPSAPAAFTHPMTLATPVAIHSCAHTQSLYAVPGKVQAMQQQQQQQWQVPFVQSLHRQHQQQVPHVQPLHQQHQQQVPLVQPLHQQQVPLVQSLHQHQYQQQQQQMYCKPGTPPLTLGMGALPAAMPASTSMMPIGNMGLAAALQLQQPLVPPRWAPATSSAVTQDIAQTLLHQVNQHHQLPQQQLGVAVPLSSPAHEDDLVDELLGLLVK